MNKNKIAVYTLGIPASGKSTYIQKHYKDYIILDCDKIKETLPNYNPKKPERVHNLSKRILDKKLKNILQGNNSFVYDSTGTNTEKLLSLIDKAQRNGFYTVLIYVKTDLYIAIKRNKKRIRSVPVSVIKEKYHLVNYSFNALKLFVDSYKIVDGR
jgi:predicted kinase